ncbi:MAG: hypothetical protein AB7R87_08720 [Parvibaculaceae bacterium]|jgi:hypothetical protein
MFNEWLAGNGAEVEAMIFRSPQGWCPDQYIFRFRFGEGGWSSANILPWGMETFARAADIIGDAKP